MQAVTDQAKEKLQEFLDNTARLKATTQEIQQALESAKVVNKACNDEYTNSAGYNGRLQGLVQLAEQQLEELRKHSNATDEALKKSESVLFTCAAKVTQLDAMTSAIEDKQKVVNEVAGTAGAALLGHKFEERKKALHESSKHWKTLLILLLVLASAWIWLTHTYFHVEGRNIWFELASNFGLLMPPLFVVLFAAAQYAKERHYEEEYAFRSAVAMTMIAFADKLADEQGAHDKLIVETV
jgi:hypothetical protein